jgi:hypothetical protein
MADQDGKNGHQRESNEMLDRMEVITQAVERLQKGQIALQSMLESNCPAEFGGTLKCCL